MGRHYVLGTDHPDRPTKSGLVIGKEVDDDLVRRDFYKARDNGVHPGGWEFLELYGERGRVEVSFAKVQTIQTKQEKK